MNDPILQFSRWFTEAKEHVGVGDATAMTLATATRSGLPSARIVLLKAYDQRGFVFYTNLEGRKSGELKANPHAALCFYWPALNRQIRIEGKVEQVSDEEADKYYASRPLLSRIGAWASDQSRPLDHYETLIEKVKKLETKYSESNPPPRPPYWSGWRVVPQVMEFWSNGEYRLHNREVFTREGDKWSVGLLYP